MEEIYQLSNANKRRNKEKKKIKEDNIGKGVSFCCSVSYSGRGSLDDHSSISPRSASYYSNDNEDDEASSVAVPAKHKTNTQEFMKQIGWLGEIESHLLSPNDRQGKQHRRTRSGASDNDKKQKRRKKPNCSTFPPKGSTVTPRFDPKSQNQQHHTQANVSSASGSPPLLIYFLSFIIFN